jgi:hypothetical protein
MGNVNNVDGLANILGCGFFFAFEASWSSIGSLIKAKTIWNGVIEKIERHLVGWKRMYLSSSSSITLIKSTLSNMPTHFMSLFPLLVGVAHCIEKLQQDFL